MIQKDALTHTRALQQLPKAMQELAQNDFAVLDIVIESRAARELTQSMLMSTIWFDVTNGVVFAAHPDDGLYFPEFQKIGVV